MTFCTRKIRYFRFALDNSLDSIKIGTKKASVLRVRLSFLISYEKQFPVCRRLLFERINESPARSITRESEIEFWTIVCAFNTQTDLINGSGRVTIVVSSSFCV